MTTADAPARTYSSAPGRWVLAITVLGSGIAALDATVVKIALPAIGRDFHTSIATLLWVMTGYILTLAAFLLIGGSPGDHFGRRKVYMIGIVWFALASAACMIDGLRSSRLVSRNSRARRRSCGDRAWLKGKRL
jgi:MFS family permease